ncbi:MAG: hypothetical protein HY720_28665 [Planctomycetes bacterium]|nr:hypothetical protein [Planctomycetota bacterium]
MQIVRAVLAGEKEIPVRYALEEGRWVVEVPGLERSDPLVERLAGGRLDPELVREIARAYLRDRIERWRDPAAFAADLGVASIYGDARTLLDLPASVEAIGPALVAATAACYLFVGSAPLPSPATAWEWTAPSDAPLARPARKVSPAAPRPPGGPRVLVEAPAGAYPEGERLALARALFREFVVERGIAYAPWAAVQGDRIVAGAWTSPEHVEEVATVLARRGRVRIAPPLAREPER